MSNPEPLQALLLAGTRAGEADSVARAAGVPCKALAPVAGRPMIEHSLAALLDSPGIGRIEVAMRARETIAADAPGLAGWLERKEVQLIEPEASPARTVAAALDRLPAGAPLLVTTADHALLSAAMLEQFLGRCLSSQVDAFGALLPLEILAARYPDMKRTGLRLRDGRYSGCNLFLLRGGPGARGLVSFWIHLESLRKSPLRMARALGPFALLAYALRLLTLPQAIAWIGRRAGACIAPILLDIPEAAIDVDTPHDLAFVNRLLQHVEPTIAAGGS